MTDYSETEDALGQHIACKHVAASSQDVHSPANATHYRCPICSFIFATLSNLQDHVRTHHSATVNYRCYKCDYSFEAHSALKNHTSTNHPLEFSLSRGEPTPEKHLQNDFDCFDEFAQLVLSNDFSSPSAYCVPNQGLESPCPENPKN